MYYGEHWLDKCYDSLYRIFEAVYNTFCLIFIPFLSKAILYSIKFALGKVDFSKSGTITEGEYVRICGEVPKEEDYGRII